MTHPFDTMSYAKLKQIAKAAAETVGVLKTEHQGSLLVNHILTKRLGGEVRISQKEMAEIGAARLQVMFDRETEEFVFVALEPEALAELTPEEQEAIEIMATPGRAPMPLRKTFDADGNIVEVPA